MAAFNFHASVQEFLKVLSDLKGNEEGTKVTHNVWSTSSGTDSEKKSALDQAFRELLASKLKDFTQCEIVEENGDDKPLTNGDSPTKDKISTIQDIITFVIHHTQEKKCTNNLPIILLSDIFDTLTLENCEKLFEFVEKNVSVWTKEPFFTSGKNHLLRMCNDILRRLSKSLNTIFCGRIQLFLARLFPMEEKSALNIFGQFHLENVTVYKRDPSEFNLEENLDTMDTDDGEVIEAVNPVDFNLYKRFWCLQDFFRLPVQCFPTQGWKTFKNYVTEILKVFENHKIEYNEKRRKGNETDGVSLSDIMKSTTVQGHKEYFAKYLTNEKLLNLQINDSNFRRYFLVQILILCQYLTGYVKFKQPSHKLNESQQNWVKETVEKVYTILNETPPHGKQFAATVKHILNREENWINWKNEGCLPFSREQQKATVKPSVKEVVTPKGRRKTEKQKPVKRSVGDDFLLSSSKKLNLGTNELTRLWNLCPDNMEACKAENRLKFMPTLEKYFEDAIDQADPNAGIEEEYKVVNDPNFQWRALRLLARRSHHFFTPSTTPFKALPQYLSSVIEQLNKEFNKATTTTDSKTDIKTEPIDS